MVKYKTRNVVFLAKNSTICRRREQLTTMETTPVQLMGTSSSDAPAVAFALSRVLAPSAIMSECL